MLSPRVVADKFLDSAFLFQDIWKREGLNSIGHTYFLESDYYLEIASNGNIILCKNGTDPKKRIVSNTYKDKSPSGIAKMLSVYLKMLERDRYWD